MVSFWFIVFFCCLLAVFLPYTLRSLHPITVLFLWIVVGSMEQFSYAVLIINLNLIAQSYNLWDFTALKLVQLAGVPLLTIGGVAAAFSHRLPISESIAAFTASRIVLSEYPSSPDEKFPHICLVMVPKNYSIQTCKEKKDLFTAAKPHCEKIFVSMSYFCKSFPSPVNL